MSLTGRPISPPLPLISSSQILAPSSACLPLAASGPVSDIEKPILIGSPLWADAKLGIRASAVAAARPAAKCARVIFNRSILVPPLCKGFCGSFASGSPPRQAEISGDSLTQRQLAAFALLNGAPPAAQVGSSAHGCH